ncbi:MAG: lyase family protein [Hasllibacter sp.]
MVNAMTGGPLFGGVLGDEEVRRQFGAEALTDRMLAFERAWTRALREIGQVSEGDADRALAAIDAAMDPGALASGGARDGLPVPALVARLRDGLDEGAAAAIHSGSTSQDVLDSAMALSLLAVIDLVEGRATALSDAIDVLRARFGSKALMGRTRMQAALPVGAAHRLDSWQRALAGHLARLPVLRAEVGRVQVGGPVGLRDMPQGERMARLVAAELGLAEARPWHTDRAGIVSFGHWLTLVAGTAAKVGLDLSLMAQMGEVRLSGGGSSSAMPHKSNPVAAELATALGRFVVGQQSVLATAMLHEQERSGASWTLEWLVLPQMAEGAAAALARAADAVRQVEGMGG